MTTAGIFHILFYSDAAEFGGHELMTLDAARLLCDDTRFVVTFMAYEGNRRLIERLLHLQASTSGLNVVRIPFRSRNLQAIRSIISSRDCNRLADWMKRINPTTVVVSQGRIEASSLGLLAAKKAGLRTIGYIPMAHPVSKVGRPLLTGFREAINRRLYRLPDKFITISSFTKRMLREHGVTTDISVVPNVVQELEPGEDQRQRFRAANHIGTEQYIVAVIGRIDFRQKCQDFVLKSIVQFRHQLAGWKFLFIGEGPDAANLRKMAPRSTTEELFSILPWHDRPAEVYAGIDMLLIPSKFEGVPLVMLEAMFCGIPIVATNVDGMSEYLPEKWLFPYRDSARMIETMKFVRASDVASELARNRLMVVNQNNAAIFGSRFAQAIAS